MSKTIEKMSLPSFASWKRSQLIFCSQNILNQINLHLHHQNTGQSRCLLSFLIWRKINWERRKSYDNVIKRLFMVHKWRFPRAIDYIDEKSLHYTLIWSFLRRIRLISSDYSCKIRSMNPMLKIPKESKSRATQFSFRFYRCRHFRIRIELKSIISIFQLFDSNVCRFSFEPKCDRVFRIGIFARSNEKISILQFCFSEKTFRKRTKVELLESMDNFEEYDRLQFDWNRSKLTMANWWISRY